MIGDIQVKRVGEYIEIPSKTLIAEFKEARRLLICANIRLDLSGNANNIICTRCKTQKSFLAGSAFVTHTEIVYDKRGFGRTKRLYSAKEFVKWFESTHFEKCLSHFIIETNKPKAA